MKFMKKGILFDLDGTLWDACREIACSWNEYLAGNVPSVKPDLTTEDLRSACGKTMTAIGDMLFPQLEKEKRDRVTEGCCIYEVEYLQQHRVDSFPDAADALRALHAAGYHLYIVSNCQSGYIECFLKWFPEPALFDDIECFGNTGNGKADNIRLLCERNHLDQVVYVGDTEGDEESAREAGASFVHAAYGFGSAKHPDAVIRSMAELPACMDRFFGS